MWCEKCHYGSEVYNFKHCGHCGGTKMISKNPFLEGKKAKDAKKKTDKETSENKPESTHEDVEAITSGKVKPTIMR